MSDEPLVSVLMCTYNGRDFIEAAVADIVNQTYPNWELIVSDDGSADGTREWLQQLGDDRIRVFLQPRNLGYVRNKNFALAQAKGALITQQDQDDRSSPERLERQVTALQEHGLEIAACGFHSFFYQAIFCYLHGNISFETLTTDIIYFCNRQI